VCAAGEVASTAASIEVPAASAEVPAAATSTSGVTAATTPSTAAATTVAATCAGNKRDSRNDNSRGQDPEGPSRQSRLSLDHHHGFHSAAAPFEACAVFGHISIRRSVLGSVQAPETANSSLYGCKSAHFQ
jgi:hypothetical protein